MEQVPNSRHDLKGWGQNAEQRQGTEEETIWARHGSGHKVSRKLKVRKRDFTLVVRSGSCDLVQST